MHLVLGSAVIVGLSTLGTVGTSHTLVKSCPFEYIALHMVIP